jgi:hypothetical protein
MKLTTRHLLGALLLTLSLGLAVFEGRGLPTGRALVATPTGGDARIAQAYARHESNVPIALHGRVKRLLPDDTRGSPHQRFLLLLASGHTLLIAHNTELAPRVEGLSVGAEVSLQGEYEWNDKGGVVHWTHHDPDGRRQGGWIEFAGRRYR